MGEFRKGDFVRRTAGESLTTNDGRHGAGFVGQIADIVKGFTTEAVFTNGHAGLIEMYEPWKPRVGERVRVTGNDQWAGDGEVTELRNYGVFIVLMKTGRFAGKPGGFYIRDIEPILGVATAPVKPAALKIEAGKFYMTRDGRKVGPMIEDKWHDRDYGWTVEHEFNAEYGKAWRADGTFHVVRGKEHSADLIAEWVDDPVAKAKPSNDNAEPNFKVGDRVKCLKSYPGQFTAGKEYVVSADHFGRKYESVKVKVDDEGSTENGWLPEFFELSKPKTTTIVALIENGQPKPSSTPHVHTSTSAAEMEAKRLAAKYKGKQFGVFTLTTTHEEAAPVYDRKWQNMAALGLKIDAIKELRTVAGLTFKGAKDAVEAWIEYENAA